MLQSGGFTNKHYACLLEKNKTFLLYCVFFLCFTVMRFSHLNQLKPKCAEHRLLALSVTVRNGVTFNLS